MRKISPTTSPYVTVLLLKTDSNFIPADKPYQPIRFLISIKISLRNKIAYNIKQLVSTYYFLCEISNYFERKKLLRALKCIVDWWCHVTRNQTLLLQEESGFMLSCQS